MKKNTLFVLILSLLLPLSSLFAQRQMEKLNRGLVAVRTSTNAVFLSWRVLGSDPDNIAFNLYRDGVKITTTPISTSSNYTDASSTATTYTVKPVLNGVETGETNSASVWTNNFFEIKMDVPASVVTSDTTTCTYSPNDCSVGDVDSDGEYEIIVKWEPSNAKDNSQGGYTNNVYLDCYKLNGTKLWRIDLGKNIRAGAHYTDFEVEDFDGDGKAEVALKTAPGTKDGLGNYLSKGPAATDNDAIDYRNGSGYILTGPEYLTVFSGLTGAELATVNYNPPRNSSNGTSNDVSAWGDSYGNRVDRFLACTAYLDGVHPSIVMCRGYYSRVVLAAWDFKNGVLTQRWVYDSNTPNGANANGQGNHNLSVGDIDDDGKDEIVYGASAFDDNGKCLYTTGLGHGDAMHMTVLDPDRKGLQVWEVHENTSSPYGYEMHDAKTGTILWGVATGSDNGRGLAANVDVANRGFEMWSASGPGVSNCKGTTLTTTSSPSMNFRIYWDGDLQDELLDGTSISKYTLTSKSTLLSASDCSTNNSTKSTPCLSADIFGDWREEVIFRTNDNNLRIYTTTIPTTNKLYTLMHDAQYRDAIAWQNAGYNQPPHCGFYMGDDMDPEPVSAIYDNDKRWKTGAAWDNNTTASFRDSVSAVSTFKNGDKVLFDITAGANAAVTVTGDLTPKQVKVNSPYNVVLSGTGTLNGSMDLKKNGAGSLTLNNNNNFTGTTKVWDGDFFNNGVLSASDVYTYSFVKLGGKGTFGGNVRLGNNSSINAGITTADAAKLTFSKNLTEGGTVSYTFDVITSAGKAIANDTLVIGGNWTMAGKNTFTINTLNGTLPSGQYTLARCAGTITGDLAKIKIVGVPANLSYILVIINQDLVLSVKAPSLLTWKGNVDGKWDNGKTYNWLEVANSEIFLANDTVQFNDDATLKSVIINESVIPNSVTVNTAGTYTFSGSGSIDGLGSLTKNGAGKLIISNSNKYTGKNVLNGGTLEMATLTNGGIASPIGAAANLPANIVLNGGKLSYTGINTTIDRGFTLGSSDGTFSVSNSSTLLTTTGKIVGTGSLIKEGAGRLGLAVANTYTGGTILKAGSVVLTTDVANTSGMGVGDTITFQGGNLVMFDSNTTDNSSSWNLKIPVGSTGTLNTDGLSTITGTITGGGTLNYFTNFTGNLLASNVSKFTGTINVTTDADGGYFDLYNNINGFPGTKINLSNLVTMMYRATANVTIPVGDLTGLSNSVLGAGGGGVCTITWEIGNRNANSTFNGMITNAQYVGGGAVAAIKKVGTGTWTLTNANTYTGTTTINGGTLQANNTTGSATGTGSVLINSGGTLAGTGTISGAVTVNSGGIISLANAAAGTLTVNNNVTIASGGILAVDIDKTNTKNDLLSMTGTLTMNGKLQVTALNGTTFAAGDSIKIISGTVVGTPSEIIPATPGDGLVWDLSAFNTAGALKVKVFTGLNDLKMNTRIYPNPFKNNVRVLLDQTTDEVQASVVTLLGDIVYSNKFYATNQLNLNLDHLNKGVYLLHVKVDGNYTIRKIVKE